jgi:hypothetical protein
MADGMREFGELEFPMGPALVRVPERSELLTSALEWLDMADKTIDHALEEDAISPIRRRQLRKQLAFVRAALREARYAK